MTTLFDFADYTPPKIAGLAPWFGAKRTLASRIVEGLGPHSAYWEIFCGSCAVLLAKPPTTSETVCDLHGDLTNLARVVQDDDLAPQLFSRLMRTMCGEQLHREAAEHSKSYGNSPPPATPDLDRAYWYFVCAWNGRNGVAGTSSYNQGFCRRFTKNGGHAATRFASAVESIPEWWERLRRVTILNADAFEVLPKIEDAAGVAIYVDPPYLVKGAKYLHDFRPADHQRLASELRRFKRTRVVISYYSHPSLQTLYPASEWTHREVFMTKALVNQGMRDRSGATVAPEVLLMNGPSYA